jgi:hypothetical protein
MAATPTRILLQTTIPPTEDDWSIGRFSLLARLLRDQRDGTGAALYDVTVRDREPPGKPDSVLAKLDQSGFGQLWLFAVDTGDGLTEEDCEGISRFRRGGGGLMVTRDHMDLGSSVCSLGGVGKAHYFHSRNLDPDLARRAVDDPYTSSISWPNFHSGANGDFQTIQAVGPIHAVLADPESPTGAIRFLPSHPHEGGVGAPDGESARVIATGISQVTGRGFNISVAFELGAGGGPAIAESTFHHFVDYNWDTSLGCPSFVSETPGDAIKGTPQATADTYRYVTNIARWLSSGRR